MSINLSQILQAPFRAWDIFWFKLEGTQALDFLRITLGLLVIVILVISLPNWERFFGVAGSQPLETLRAPYTWSIFTLFDSAIWPWLLYWVGLLASILMTLGLFTRSTTLIVFVLFASMLHRNFYLVNGQDQIITMLLFFAIFAPWGRSYSLDEIWRRTRHYQKSTKEYVVKLKARWTTRLMQISIILVYFFSFPAKLQDDLAWRDGTAIYFVSLSDRWFRFPNLDIFHDLTFSLLATHGTIFLQAAFVSLVWFKATRKYVLVAFTLLNAGMLILLAQSVFFFLLSTMIGFIAFIPPESMAKFWRRFRRPKATMLYDGDCGFCVNSKKQLRALDGSQRLKLLNFREAAVRKKFPKLKLKDLEQKIHLVTANGQVKQGFYAYQYLSQLLPSLMLLAPVLYFPGASYIGSKVYDLIARHRLQLGCQSCGTEHTGICPGTNKKIKKRPRAKK